MLLRDLKAPMILGVMLATHALQSAESPAEDGYRAVASQRAEKIVATLGLEQPEPAVRAREVIANHYIQLKALHDARDFRIKAAKSDSALSDAGRAAEIQRARDEAELKIYALHYEFVSRLSAELPAAQVEKVKDGLTYGVLPNTYRVYLEMLPNLTSAQRAQILAWLTEAREHAIDGGSSEEKHGWFGKYKGRINNYLASAGIDMKAVEKTFLERQKSASPRNP